MAPVPGGRYYPAFGDPSPWPIRLLLGTSPNSGEVHFHAAIGRHDDPEVPGSTLPASAATEDTRFNKVSSALVIGSIVAFVTRTRPMTADRASSGRWKERRRWRSIGRHVGSTRVE